MDDERRVWPLAPTTAVLIAALVLVLASGDELLAAFDAVREAAGMLDAKLLDGGRDLVVGCYRVLLKSDWDGGLVMLALALSGSALWLRRSWATARTSTSS